MGAVPDLRWLPISQLVVDERYQRDIGRQGRKHIAAIAYAFDWRMFSAVVVSPVAGGDYAIMDGQHRTTAALAVGFDQVPCQIIQADGFDQAKAFTAINGRKIGVSMDQRYRAALAAADPQALAVERVTRKAGIILLRHNPSQANMLPGESIAHVSIGKIVRSYGERCATIILSAARAMAHDDVGVLKSTLIDAVEMMFSRHPTLQQDAAVQEKFAGLNAHSVMERGFRLLLEQRGKNRASAFYEAIRERLAGQINSTPRPVATTPLKPSVHRAAIEAAKAAVPATIDRLGVR
jgi:ParB-like nuclease domain